MGQNRRTLLKGITGGVALGLSGIAVGPAAATTEEYEVVYSDPDPSTEPFEFVRKRDVIYNSRFYCEDEVYGEGEPMHNFVIEHENGREERLNITDSIVDDVDRSEPHKVSSIVADDCRDIFSIVNITEAEISPFEGPITFTRGEKEFSIGPPEDPDSDGLYEDVNGDGQVNSRDKEALSKIVSARKQEILDLTSEQVAALDFNDDGTLSGEDVDDL